MSDRRIGIVAGSRDQANVLAQYLGLERGPRLSYFSRPEQLCGLSDVTLFVWGSATMRPRWQREWAPALMSQLMKDRHSCVLYVSDAPMRVGGQLEFEGWSTPERTRQLEQAVAELYAIVKEHGLG